MFAMMTPAREVGGDLYGYVLLGDLLYFCVGDVSGKGVPAALYMAEVTRMFRTLVEGKLTLHEDGVILMPGAITVSAAR